MRSIADKNVRNKGDNLYDFSCGGCNALIESFAQFEEKQLECLCGAPMHRLFPISQALHHFDPYFDEGLGVDIHSKRQRADVMRVLGVVESGDKVKGSRNFEEKATTIDRIPELRGLTVGDLQRENERRKEAGDNFMVQTENSDGSLSAPKRAADLPSKQKSKGRMKKEDEWDQRISRKRSSIITK